jgi:hypothetical protein
MEIKRRKIYSRAESVGFVDRDFANAVAKVSQSLLTYDVVEKWSLGPHISAAGND